MLGRGKRFLCILLIIVMCLTSAPMQYFFEMNVDYFNLFGGSAMAADGSGICGENAKWKFDSKTKTLTIYGTGKMYDYSEYYGETTPYGDINKYPIKKVVIQDGITEIGDEAFSYLSAESKITSVKIADSVTVIGRSAFSNAKIKTLKFPKNLKKIEGWAFSSCNNLKKVTIPDSVTFIGERAFCSCASLESIVVGDGVKEVNDIASLCDNLTKLTLGKNVKTFKCDLTDSGNIMCAVFVDKDNKFLSSDKNGVLFNKDKTRLLLFPGKSDLETYTIPKTVKAVAANAFHSTTELVKIDASSVERIGKYAFSYSGIKEIVLGDNLESINDGAFLGCEDLSEVKLPASVTKLGRYVFMKSAAVFVDSENKKYSSDDNGVLFNKAKTTLISCPSDNKNDTYEIPETVKKISESAFAYNKNFKNITFPQSLETVEEDAFFCCDNLQSISLPKNISYIGSSAFAACDSLEKVEIEEGSTAKIGEEAFFGCDQLTDISISASIFEIGSNVIDGTKYYRDLEVKNHVGPFYLGNVLCGVIKETEKINIREGTIGVADEAMRCSEVNSITIPDSVKHIGKNAFTQMYYLKKITVSKDNKHFIVDNGVLLNKNKTRLIKYFANNSAKEYVAPKTVRYVDDYAFCTGKNLEKIDFSADVEDINICMFMGTRMEENFPEDEVIYYKKHAIGYYNEHTVPGVLIIKDGTKSVAVSEYCEFPYDVIYIPKSVKEIRSLPSIVYYEGSKEEWNKIEFSDDLEYIIDGLKIYYNFNKNKHAHTYYSGVKYPEKCFSPMLLTYTCPCGKSYSREGVIYNYHIYSDKEKIEKRATMKNDGVKYGICAYCGKKYNKIIIENIASVKLSYKNTKYNGKVKTPVVIAVDSNGYQLYEGKDYTVKYPSGRKEVGVYYITVTFKGEYSGTKKLKLNILPA